MRPEDSRKGLGGGVLECVARCIFYREMRIAFPLRAGAVIWYLLLTASVVQLTVNMLCMHVPVSVSCVGYKIGVGPKAQSKRSASAEQSALRVFRAVHDDNDRGA